MAKHCGFDCSLPKATRPALTPMPPFLREMPNGRCTADRPTFSCCCVGWTGLRASAPSLARSLARSLAGGKEKDVATAAAAAAAAAAVWRPNSLIYCPSSACLSVSAVRRMAVFPCLLNPLAISGCFRGRRPPSSSFFPFFVCFALPAFLPPKEIQWPAGAPLPLARSLLSPPCLLFCAASLCKRYSRKIAGRPYKVCWRLLARGVLIHGPLISCKPLAVVMLTDSVRALMQDPCKKKNTSFVSAISFAFPPSSRFSTWS